MRFNRQLLAEKLEKLNSFVDTKDTIIQSSCYIFTGDKVVAYSGNEIAVIQMKSDFECAVSKAEFFSYIEKLKDKDITIAMENDILTISGKNKSAQLPVYLEINEAYKAVKLPTDYQPLDQGTFYPALDTAAKFTSKASDEYVDQCVEFAGGRLFASDKKMMAHLKISEDFGGGVVYVHSSSAKKLVGVPCANWAMTDEFMFFKTDDVTIGARISINDTTRLSLDELAGMTAAKGEELKLPKELGEACERIKATYGEGAVMLAIKGNVLYLHTWNKSGTAQIKMRERFKCVYKGKPFKFVIELGFLRTLVDLTETCAVLEEASCVTALVADDAFVFCANFDEV